MPDEPWLLELDMRTVYRHALNQFHQSSNCFGPVFWRGGTQRQIDYYHVLYMRYCDGFTVRQIAEYLHVSRSRADQLLKIGILRFRYWSKNAKPAVPKLVAMSKRGGV